MKHITPLALAAVTLTACQDRTPTAPQVARPDISATTGIGFGSPLYGMVSAQTTVTGCQGIGLIASNNVQYGTCTTDANGGTGSVVFSNDGFTVALRGRTQKGAEQVASFWESNGPVSATSQICVAISVTELSVKGLGGVQEQLVLSYNGIPQNPLTSSVTATGELTSCGAVPAGATNVFWQLITIAGGDKPASRVGASQTFRGVSIK